MKTTRSFLRLALLAALTLLSSRFALSPCLAGTHTWTGASGDGKWSTAFNWANNSPPVSGEAAPVVLQFPAAGTKNATNDLATLMLDQLQITGDNYVIAGAGAGASVTLRSQTGLSSTFFISGANAVLTNFNFTLATNINPYASVSVGTGDTATFRCQFTGPGGLIKRANGTLILDGNAPNTYSGRTEIQGGTVRLSQSGVAVPGELVIGYSALTNLASVELMTPNQVGDTANVLVNCNGSFVPGVFNDTIGSLTLSNADLVAGIGLTLQGNFTSIGTNLLTGTVRLGGANRTFHITGQLTADAFIENPTGTAGIIKSGQGTMELRRSNTYNGITDVKEGTLIVSHSGGLGTVGAGTQVSPGATLLLKGSVTIANETLSLSGTGVSSNGAVCATGGVASWTGPVNLTGDTFIGANDAPDQFSISGAIGGTGNVTKVGYGRVVFSGLNANTFNGVTRVWGGTLRLAKTANLRAVRELEIGSTNAGAICELGAPNQIDDTARVIVWHYGNFQLGGFDDAIAGLSVIGSSVDTGGGLLTLLGDVEAVSWYEWDWIMFDGTTHSPSIFGRLSLGGATRTIHLSGQTAAASPAIYLPCVIVDGNGTGGVRKTGPGWMFLAALNTYSGPTLIEEGSVSVSTVTALGSSGQGTVVSDGAELLVSLDGLSISEPLTLNGRGGIYGIGALQCAGTNSWTGPITLATDTAIGVLNANSHLTISGAVGGPGQLSKIGPAVLSFAGGNPNVFTGGLNVEMGTVLLNKPSGVTTVRNQMRVGTTNSPAGTARVAWRGAHQVQDGAAIFVEASGALDLGIYFDEVGPVNMRGGVISGASGVLILGGDVRAENPSAGNSFINCNLSLAGVTRTFEVVDGTLTVTRDIQDGGAAAGIRKTGPGTLILDNAQTTYSGLTEAQRGNVELHGTAKFGNTTDGTIFYSGARLILVDANIGLESLTFDYLAPFWVYPDMICLGTNSWQGPLTFRHYVTIRTDYETDRLTLSGIIGGDASASLVKDGAGVMRIAGTNSNTLPAEMMAREGVLELAKTNAVASAGPVIVSASENPSPLGATLRLVNHHQISDTQRITVHKKGLFDLNGFTDMVGGLDLSTGEVRTGAGQIRLNGDVEVSGVSTINGRLSLGDDSRTFHLADDAVLVLPATISALDPGAGLTQTGSGDVYYGGTNTFGGEMRIFGGQMYAETPFAFGSAASGTVVSNYAGITLDDAFSVTNEPLRLVQGRLFGKAFSTNAWHGPITIGEFSVIESLGTNGLFLLSGVISGHGLLGLSGNMVVHGSQPNTFTGELWAREGLLQLSKTNAFAVPAALTIGFFDDEEVSTVRLLQPNQIADSSVVTVHRYYSYFGSFGSPFVLDLNGFAETIGSLAGNGNVQLGSGKLTVGGNGTSTEFSGTITGSGAAASLVKIGSGALTLSGTNNYPGITRVAAGTLLVNGSIVPSPVQIDTDASLGGAGVTGDVACNGGRLIPGPTMASPSYGRLKTGTVSFNSGSTLRCELGGPVGGTEFDQLEVNGFLNIANTTLNVQSAGLGAVDSQYTVIRVATGAAASGTFAGLPEGAVFTPLPGRTYRITYHGGPTGRDIVLTQLTVPLPAQFSGIKTVGVGEVQLSGSGTPGFAYDVYAATNVVTTNWVKIGNITADGNGSMEFIDNDVASFPMRFYRIVLP